MILALSAAVLAGSCSFVDFEPSPYAPRALQVFYSEQEDLTFFVWRIADVADPELLSFELWQDGELREIDLQEAPFPSEAFGCDRLYLCLQYQVPGRWSGPAGDTPALRAVHKRFGPIPSAPTRQSQGAESFTFEPVATANNRFADAGLVDLLDELDFPIRRSFEWALTGAETRNNERVCDDAPASGWQPLSPRVELPQNWTDDPPCMAVRPRRSDRPSVALIAPLEPGPVLNVAELNHRIDTIRHPTHIAFLVDLQVTNPGRCQQIVNAVRETILDEFAEENKQVRELGVYYPRDGQNSPTSGCDQAEARDYPLNDILADARNAAAAEVERPTFALVVLNNLQLTSTPEKTAQLQTFNIASELPDTPFSFGWLVGAEAAYPGVAWGWNTPWQALESRDFEPPLRSAVRYIFPLSSTPELENYELPLDLPAGSQNPRYVKFCQYLPAPAAYVVDNREWSVSSERLPWPAAGQPHLRYELNSTRFALYGDFYPSLIEVVYETCDDFCDNAFQARNGINYESWLQLGSACQWGGL